MGAEQGKAASSCIGSLLFVSVVLVAVLSGPLGLWGKCEAARDRVVKVAKEPKVTGSDGDGGPAAVIEDEAKGFALEVVRAVCVVAALLFLIAIVAGGFCRGRG